jgi:hypothetical protein
VPLTLKSINVELAKHGYTALLARGDGYYYFRDGEAADWLDSTVRVPTLSSLTLAQWLDEFERLKKLNQEMLQAERPKQKLVPRGGRKRSGDQP